MLEFERGRIRRRSMECKSEIGCGPFRKTDCGVNERICKILQKVIFWLTQRNFVHSF